MLYLSFDYGHIQIDLSDCFHTYHIISLYLFLFYLLGGLCQSWPRVHCWACLTGTSDPVKSSTVFRHKHTLSWLECGLSGTVYQRRGLCTSHLCQKNCQTTLSVCLHWIKKKWSLKQVEVWVMVFIAKAVSKHSVIFRPVSCWVVYLVTFGLTLESSRLETIWFERILRWYQLQVLTYPVKSSSRINI